MNTENPELTIPWEDVASTVGVVVLALANLFIFFKWRPDATNAGVSVSVKKDEVFLTSTTGHIDISITGASFSGDQVVLPSGWSVQITA